VELGKRGPAVASVLVGEGGAANSSWALAPTPVMSVCGWLLRLTKKTKDAAETCLQLRDAARGVRQLPANKAAGII
jgi:hypothetical protein